MTKMRFLFDIFLRFSSVYLTVIKIVFQFVTATSLISSCSSTNESSALDLKVHSWYVRSHIAYLADDKLKGRMPGTLEYQMAIDYVIKQFKSIGIESAGENSSYLQAVKIRTGVIDETSSKLTVIEGSDKRDLVAGNDYIFFGDLNTPRGHAAASVVFVGYGIDAPHLEYNDYKGIDVQGKIIMAMTGAPKSFPSTELAHFSSYSTKFETAIDHGAVGIILVSPDEEYHRIIKGYRFKGNHGMVTPNGESFGRTAFGRGLRFAAIMNKTAAAKIFLQDTDQFWSEFKNKTVSGLLKVSISALTVTSYTEFTSYNVLGRLDGSDAKLKNEYLIYSAHLDHLGIGEPVKADSIYNGAHDNASGVSCVLEIARLFSQLKVRPKRTVVFLMTTGEEMGLLGSDYFTRYPTVPIENIVANINIDMPTFISPLMSIEPVGAEHSSLINNVREAAGRLNLEIRPDHAPELVRFIRSDQYNFVRAGIPAIHVKYGLKGQDSLFQLASSFHDFMTKVYHKPNDELNDHFDFRAAEVYVKLNFLIGYSVSRDVQRPYWNKDDFFEKQLRKKK